MFAGLASARFEVGLLGGTARYTEANNTGGFFVNYSLDKENVFGLDYLNSKFNSTLKYKDENVEDDFSINLDQIDVYYQRNFKMRMLFSEEPADFYFKIGMANFQNVRAKLDSDNLQTYYTNNGFTTSSYGAGSTLSNGWFLGTGTKYILNDNWLISLEARSTILTYSLKTEIAGQGMTAEYNSNNNHISIGSFLLVFSYLFSVDQPTVVEVVSPEERRIFSENIQAEPVPQHEGKDMTVTLSSEKVIPGAQFDVDVYLKEDIAVRKGSVLIKDLPKTELRMVDKRRYNALVHIPYDYPSGSVIVKVYILKEDLTLLEQFVSIQIR